MSETPRDNPYAAPRAPTETPVPRAEDLSSDDRNLAVVSHLGALVGFAVPFGNVLVPLLLWWFRREHSSFVEDHTRESLNFELSVCVYAALCFVLMFVLIGFVLALGLALFQIVFVVKGALAARRGERFRYPLAIRFLS